jgi:hypothetical protein
LRGQVMRGAGICLADFSVALLASRIPHEVAASRSSFVDRRAGLAGMAKLSLLWNRSCSACRDETCCASQYHDCADELHCCHGKCIPRDTLADILFALNANTKRGEAIPVSALYPSDCDIITLQFFSN